MLFIEMFDANSTGSTQIIFSKTNTAVTEDCSAQWIKNII